MNEPTTFDVGLWQCVNIWNCIFLYTYCKQEVQFPVSVQQKNQVLFLFPNLTNTIHHQLHVCFDGNRREFVVFDVVVVRLIASRRRPLHRSPRTLYTMSGRNNETDDCECIQLTSKLLLLLLLLFVLLLLLLLPLPLPSLVPVPHFTLQTQHSRFFLLACPVQSNQHHPLPSPHCLCFSSAGQLLITSLPAWKQVHLVACWPEIFQEQTAWTLPPPLRQSRSDIQRWRQPFIPHNNNM